MVLGWTWNSWEIGLCPPGSRDTSQVGRYEKVSDVEVGGVRFANKNLTPHKTHKNSFLIAKIDQTKPKKDVFLRTKIGITSLWEHLEGKLLTPGQLLGHSWKLWSITIQTSYWEGRWHQNWFCSGPTKKFICGHATSWKMKKIVIPTGKARTLLELADAEWAKCWSGWVNGCSDYPFRLLWLLERLRCQ